MNRRKISLNCEHWMLQVLIKKFIMESQECPWKEGPREWPLLPPAPSHLHPQLRRDEDISHYGR